MVNVRLQTVCQFEVDTDTGQSRVLRQYTTPIGTGSKMQKPKKKEFDMVTEEIEEVYLG